MFQMASAMAFTVWRLAEHSLKHMRTAQFDIDAGPQYFAFLSEFLVFLILVADRIAYRNLEAGPRQEFTTAMAIRLAEILEENQDNLLGQPAGMSYKNQFIELFNALSSDYAEFDYTDEGPGFAFTRYLGSRLTAIMVEKDQAWVVSQVMEIEAPEAVKAVQKAMQGLFNPEPHRVSERVRMGE
jgi:hypothetical protein